MSQFTLVRHSAYAVGGNASFEEAVEACELTAQQAYLVRAAGGLVFATRAAAQAAAQAVNVPPGEAAVPPGGAGYFSSLRIQGAEIYVPRTTPR